MWIIIILVLIFVSYIFFKTANSPIDTQQLAREIEFKNAASEWLLFKNQVGSKNVDNLLEKFIEDFYMRDHVKVKNVLENLELVQNPTRKMIDGIGTNSMRLIDFIPPAFSSYFIAAYPDVYLWSQKEWDNGKIHAVEKINRLSDEEVQRYLSDINEKMKFYRMLIDQYKSEIGKLECK